MAVSPSGALLAASVQRLNGDDQAETTSLPGGDGGTRDGDLPGNSSRAMVDHLLPEPMVVGAADLGSGRDDGDHRESISRHRQAVTET